MQVQIHNSEIDMFLFMFFKLMTPRTSPPLVKGMSTPWKTLISLWTQSSMTEVLRSQSQSGFESQSLNFQDSQSLHSQDSQESENLLGKEDNHKLYLSFSSFSCKVYILMV